VTSGFDNRAPDLPSWTQLLGINLRRLRLGLLILVLLGVLAWGGRRLFNEWRQKHLVAQARGFLAQGDIRSAALSAQRALQLNFNDIAATRLLSGLADRFGSPASLFWHSRLAQLEPGNLPDILAWASAAMRFGDWAAAAQALSTVTLGGRHTPQFQQTAGALALALRQIPLAEAHFAVAARLDPANEVYALNLATVRLASTNTATARRARQVLDRLRNEPRFKTLVLRALTSDAERRQDTNGAIHLARELEQSPRAGFNDHLIYLDLLHRARDPGFAAYLNRMQTLAGRQPQDIYTLLTWMNARGMERASLTWADRLPAGLVTQVPIPLAVAEAYAMEHNWTRLQALVSKGDWGPLDSLRLAFWARMFREQDRSREFGVKWRQALEAARDNPQLLSMLARVVDGWGWQAEAEQTWWVIAKGDTGQTGALQSLYRLYRTRGDASGLYRVVARGYALNPADLVTKNNLAQLSLLLNQDVARGRQLAQENYQAHPTNPIYLSTYAFSLYRQGKTAEALKLFQQIPQTLRRQPVLAAYYGVLLLANGDRVQAHKYLAIANQAPGLLPEEQAMVTDAWNRLGQPQSHPSP
jgi:predicted Zn-dependent protease